MKIIKNILSLLFIASYLFVNADETPWPVPEDEQKKTAPALFTNEMKDSGKEIYLKNCKSCHGDIGQNNMVPLNPLPKDLSTVGAQSDGSFYYKIKEGRITMPSFKNTLSVADKWNVIAYIRSFHKDYLQPEPTKLVEFGGSAVTLILDFLEETNQFKVIANGKDKDVIVPAEGVEVAIFTERFFGNLKLADNKVTNKDGVALFEIPKKLPGDEHGNLKVIAKIADAEKYGEVEVSKEFSAGLPNNVPGLTEQRAMWNIVSKAPWWITFAYPIAVLAVFGTIGYILLLLRKVFLLGKEE